MRTTLPLDDDVLAAAKVLARHQAQRNGLFLLPLQPGGAPVDLELVKQLRDEVP